MFRKFIKSEKSSDPEFEIFLDQLISEDKLPGPDPFFLTRLQARMEREEKEPRGFVRFFRRAAVVSLIAASVIAGIFFGNGITRSMQNRPVSRDTGLVQYADENHILDIMRMSGENTLIIE